MTQLIQANELTLSQLEDRFNLRQVLDNPTFVREWQDNLPKLSEAEMQALDRVGNRTLNINVI
jgi:hypothetical protein